MSDSKKLNTAMILAAGLGTRLKPWTDKHPKALALVNGKSLLQLNVEYLMSYGITKIIINIHHFPEQIINLVETYNGWGAEIIFSDESKEVLETGGGFKKAIPFFKNEENILLMNVDVLTSLNIDEMFEFHNQQNAVATLAVTKRITSRYFVFDNQKNLCGWLNSATNTVKGIEEFNNELHCRLAFSGIHIINNKLFSLVEFDGKFTMVDVYLNLMNSNKIVAYNHSDDKFLDVGKPESILLAEQMFR